jgi:crossover junction endodeoxyribonuclease RusA
MLTLPWPHKSLQPNARVHRMQKAKYAKEYRSTCYWLAKQAKPIKGHLLILFSPPTRQARDLDNCLAALKAGLDGIADAWGINDREFRPLTIDFSGQTGGFIEISLYNQEK